MHKFLFEFNNHFLMFSFFSAICLDLISSELERSKTTIGEKEEVIRCLNEALEQSKAKAEAFSSTLEEKPAQGLLSLFLCVSQLALYCSLFSLSFQWDKLLLLANFTSSY